MISNKASDQNVRGRLVKQINMKQRQFNFAQQPLVSSIQPEQIIQEIKTDAVTEPQIQDSFVENRLVLYEPRKIVKVDPLAAQSIQKLTNIKNNVVNNFINQLQSFKMQVNKSKNQDEEQNGKQTKPSYLSKISSKIQRKNKEQMIRLIQQQEYPQKYESIPQSLDFEFQVENINEMNQLNDIGVMSLSKSMRKNKKSNLTLDLFKKWHTDTSDLSDQAVENLSKGIHNMPDLNELELSLQGWGYWNNNISNSALNHMTNALRALNHLNALKLDLNMWAYENENITDKGTEALLGGISQLKDLGKLEINMKGWGDSNQNITDESVNHLSKCLRKLGNLSEVKLVLWEKISKDAIKKLNKSLSELHNLTQIDLKFESSSGTSQPISAEDNPNRNQNLQQLKQNALNKRRLLFQSESINQVYDGIFNQQRQWDIQQRLF